ncbi:hypothetical protein ACMYQ1_09815 [Shewanella oncorhynchi]|uniref:hypothetical protein n=1 Tax=Shewanella oncorhynchi TaxID=2726434 RepID=UPI0039EEC2CA
MSPFFEKIKNSSIKTPTQKGFCLTKWKKSWDSLEVGSASERDAKLYKAGIVIFNLLEEVRKELQILYKEQTPRITNNQLIMAYLSLSNRDRSIVAKSLSKCNFNIHSSTNSNNAMGNEITLQEISDGAVDGLEKAIFLCKMRINNSQELFEGTDPVTDLEFITKESYFSQLYGMYENYWHAILWNDYELIECDHENKIYMVKQPMDKYEIGSFVSQIRKSRLGAHSAVIAIHSDIQCLYNKDKYISIVKNGRKKELVCLSIKSADDEIRAMNSDWRTKSFFLSDNFGADVLDCQNKLGFSINESLEVFRNLMLLSIIFTNKYPYDDSFSNLKKLSQYCPKVDKIELRNSLKKSTGFELDKIDGILNFIEYKALKKQDLWCHPIISISTQQYALSTSALITPVILRVVEHWLVALDISFQDKGLAYEGLIIDGVNSAIKMNHYIKDFNSAVSRRIKLKEAEEEIDLILRIGNVILIGEAKSIVTTDSPISNYRTVEILKHAASQVKRKTAFVENNLEKVFEKLNWEYDCSKEYVFSKCILNSGRMYVGFDIDGIPVCDEKILLKYFRDNKVSLASFYDEVTGVEKCLAWAELYNNIEELENNLDLYLKNPPQIFENVEHFEYKTTRLPCLNEGSYKILFKRFIPKNLKINDRIKAVNIFPVRKIENYESEIEKADFIV